MRDLATGVLLTGAVLGVWLGCAGFARLRTTLDRLHCGAFVNAVPGVLVAAAAFAADGFSVRVGKIVLVVVASLVAGAATAHAIGRMVVLRQQPAPDGEAGP